MFQHPSCFVEALPPLISPQRGVWSGTIHYFRTWRIRFWGLIHEKTVSRTFQKHNWKQHIYVYILALCTYNTKKECRRWISFHLGSHGVLRGGSWHTSMQQLHTTKRTEHMHTHPLLDSMSFKKLAWTASAKAEPSQRTRNAAQENPVVRTATAVAIASRVA